ncbi:MAG: DinB family protein [Candidatus Hermodarchaeota archaeon]|nr:DinB family protein [Candidatus Hermodarchaeota archaeon]
MLHQIGQYHIWAGITIRQVLEQLTKKEYVRDFEGQSVQSITQHIVAALETCFFIADQSEDESVFERALKASKDQLLTRWSELDQRLHKIISQGPEGHITVPHITEQPFDIPAIDFYFQYVFHTIHHRGQLATILRKLGKEVPGTDYLMFLANH